MGWKFGVAAPGKTVHSDVESRGALSHAAGANLAGPGPSYS
jgi:hypothetical protein